MRANQARAILTKAEPADIDVKTFWRVLSQRATGMTVVTGRSDDGPVGFLGLSAAHVTANPPTMLVSIDQKTSALTGILSHRCFAINYLPANADVLANEFSGKGALTGAGRFVEGEWGTLSSGAPILKSALGAFDCLVEDVIDRDAVSIVIGRVVAVATNNGEPLIFFRGKSWVGVGSPS
jgi:flavin reductase (DIM6/NTAB) family NADH-FMN oxidoreductase RutF